MITTLQPPPTVQARPYALVNDLQAAERALLYDAFKAEVERAGDPSAVRASLWERIDRLETARRDWFTQLIGPRPKEAGCVDGR